MRLATIGIAALAGILPVCTSSAEDLRYYTAHSTLKNLRVAGGIGSKTDGFNNASWSGTAQITESTGYKVKVNFSCISTDQPTTSRFDRYVTCDHISESGSTTSSSAMVCMKETDDGTEMSCSGYLQVHTGDIKGRAALVTEYYRFVESGGSTTRTGHWIK